MTSVSVFYGGQKVVTKITAMQPLLKIVEEASQKFNLDREACQLQYNNKTLDLSTPFRIANLPTGAKITLISNQRSQNNKQQLGIGKQQSNEKQQQPYVDSNINGKQELQEKQTQQKQPEVQGSQYARKEPLDFDTQIKQSIHYQDIAGREQGARQQQEELPIDAIKQPKIQKIKNKEDEQTVDAGSSLQLKQQLRNQQQEQDQQQLEQQQQQLLQVQNHQQHPQQQQQQQQKQQNQYQQLQQQQQQQQVFPIQGDLIQGTSNLQKQIPEQQPFSADTSQGSTEMTKASTQVAKSLNDYQYFVYTEKELYLYRTIQQQMIQQSYQQSANQEEFYELGTQDYRQMQQAKKQREIQNQNLKTQKLRDQEEHSKASQYKTAFIRLIYPDEVVVEVRMHPLDKVKSLIKIASQTLHEYLREELYLFTTPPKMVLQQKDEDLTLYKIGFVPAANVRIGFKSYDQVNLGQNPDMEIIAPYINTDVMDRIGIEPPEMDSIDKELKQSLLKQGEQQTTQQRQRTYQNINQKSFLSNSGQNSRTPQNVHGFSSLNQGQSKQNIQSSQHDEFTEQRDEEEPIGDSFKRGYQDIKKHLPKWFKMGQK